MHGKILAVLGAVSLFAATPAIAQDFPLKSGNFWTVVEVTIDDGHFGDYADFLASTSRKTNDFAKSKGWIKGYYILPTSTSAPTSRTSIL